jgi:hypothetical protein
VNREVGFTYGKTNWVFTFIWFVLSCIYGALIIWCNNMLIYLTALINRVAVEQVIYLMENILKITVLTIVPSCVNHRCINIISPV